MHQGLIKQGCRALVAAVLLFTAPLLARPALANGSELVPATSTPYLWAELEQIQNGTCPTSGVYPYTSDELDWNVLGIEKPASPPLSAGLILSVEPYYAAFSTPYSNIPRFTNDVIYLHDQFPSLLAVGVTLGIGDTVYLKFVADDTTNVNNIKGKTSILPWQGAALVNMEAPRESYLSLSIPHANLALGRFKSGIGHGYFGSTFLNGKAPFYDQVRATYYSDFLKFYYILGSSASLLDQKEAVVQNNPNWDSYNYDHEIFDNPVKMFAYHGLEVHPADWVTIGIGEMNIIGGKFPDLNMINPVGIWHNTYTAGASNVMMRLDASVVPFRGLLLFGEFAMDDLVLPGLEEATSKPTSLAWQVGAKYVLPFSNDIKHAVGVEFTHVDPWTYARWQPYLTMYQRIILQGGYAWVDVPLGFTYGSDLNHFGGYYTVVSKDGFQADLSYQHLDKGPIDLGAIQTSVDSNGDPVYTPVYYDQPGWTGITSGPWGHGIVEQRDTIALSLEFPLPYSLTLDVAGSYTWINNFDHVEGSRSSLSMLTAGLCWSF